MNNTIEELRKRVAAGLPQSDAINAMHRDGLPIIEAIKATRELYCINLGAAKNAVSSHPAYAQIAEASKPLQDEVIRAFQELGKGNSDQS
ncbi:MAG: hypothetical protein ACK5UC_17735 [Planctomycetaceae bacterium]|jgi:hypothetical protein